METARKRLERMLAALQKDVADGKYGKDDIDTTAFGEALQTALGETTPSNKEWTVFCDFVEEDESDDAE